MRLRSFAKTSEEPLVSTTSEASIEKGMTELNATLNLSRIPQAIICWASGCRGSSGVTTVWSSSDERRLRLARYMYDPRD